MPYKLKGNCVVKSDTGETVKCHASHAKAVKHLKALYANVDKEHQLIITPKEFAQEYELTEKDFSYAQSETWVVDSAISALGYLMSTARSEMYQQESDDSKSIIALMRQLSAFITKQIDEMYDAVDTPSELMYKEVSNKGQLTTAKDVATGRWRWTLITSSAFEDRDGEIVSEKALQKDCDQMEVSGDYGELLWWHCDGEKHGTEKEARPYIPLGNCDTSFVYKKLNIESGLYYDDAVGEVFSKKAKEHGASKQFFHLPDEPDEEGVYTYIRTKERSIMPRGNESNLLTRLFGKKEKEMATVKERIAALREKLGDEETDKVLQHAKEQSKKAEKLLTSKEKKTDDDDLDEDDEDEEGDEKEATALELAVKEMKETFNVGLDKVSKELTPLKEQVKEHGENLALLEKNVQTLNRRVKRLMGDQPKNATKDKADGFKASEDDDTEISEETAKQYEQALKERAEKLKLKGAGEQNEDSLYDWFKQAGN